MPFDIVAEEGPSEEVLELTENVNSDSITYTCPNSNIISQKILIRLSTKIVQTIPL